MFLGFDYVANYATVFMFLVQHLPFKRIIFFNLWCRFYYLHLTVCDCDLNIQILSNRMSMCVCSFILLVSLLCWYFGQLCFMTVAS